MIIALFDCDGTLFSAQFGRGLIEYATRNGRKATVRAYYLSLLIPFLLQKVKLISKESFSRKVMANLAWFIKGWNEQEGQAAFKWVMHEYLLPSQQADVIARLRSHQTKGHKVVLVSAQFIPALQLFGEYFKADGVVGTQVERKGDQYSGRITPPVITGQDKNLGVRDFFASRDMEIDWASSFAYADSITDLELFQLVGNPVAVYPDAQLNKVALASNWEIIGTPKT